MGQTTCSRCGSPVNAGDLFCLNCGAMLDPKLGGGASSSWSIPKTQATTPAAAPVSAPTTTPVVKKASTTPTVRTVGVTPTTTRANNATGAVTTKAARSYNDDTESFEMHHGVVPNPIPLDDVGDDSYTIVVDDDDDPDAPTFVFVEEPVLTLTRLRNGETIQLELPAMVGKGTKATARVSGNRGISRQHALITQEGESYLIEDNDSTNGTFVGELRLQPHAPVELEDGMTFRLADEDFEFHID